MKMPNRASTLKMSGKMENVFKEIKDIKIQKENLETEKYSYQNENPIGQA